MKNIDDIDLNDYHKCTNTLIRKAVKAITFKDNKLVMIKSKKYGEMKFPGGGQDLNESDFDTLKRELLEETGLSLKSETIIPYGFTHEIRKSVFEPNLKLDMTSIYYLCETKDEITTLNLDEYEHHYGYHMVLVDIEEAINNNQDLLSNKKETVIQYVPWTERELIVLQDLKAYLKK
jgi:8-oxo-dGTP pyrophosphatase MutT (NUDIX family)